MENLNMLSNVNAIIKLRTDTIENWIINNPIIHENEQIIVKLSDGKIGYKLGTGVEFNRTPFISYESITTDTINHGDSVLSLPNESGTLTTLLPLYSNLQVIKPECTFYSHIHVIVSDYQDFSKVLFKIDSKINPNLFKALSNGKWFDIGSGGFGIEYNNCPILINFRSNLKSYNLTSSTILYINYYWYYNNEDNELIRSDVYSSVLPSNTEVGANSQDVVSKSELNNVLNGLITNDFTNEYKSKLDSIESSAQVNKIESIEVNGVTASITEKEAKVNIDSLVSDDSGKVYAKVNYSTGDSWVNLINDKVSKIVFGKDKYVAISNSNVYYSVDSINWTKIELSDYLVDIIYENNVFIIVGRFNIFYSIDGVHYTSKIVAEHETINPTKIQNYNIVYFKNRFILSTYELSSSVGIIGAIEDSKFYESSDGINWSILNINLGKLDTTYKIHLSVVLDRLYIGNAYTYDLKTFYNVGVYLYNGLINSTNGLGYKSYLNYNKSLGPGKETPVTGVTVFRDESIGWETSELVVYTNCIEWCDGYYLLSTDTQGLFRSVDGLKWVPVNVGINGLVYLFYHNGVIFGCSSKGLFISGELSKKVELVQSTDLAINTSLAPYSSIQVIKPYSTNNSHIKLLVSTDPEFTKLLFKLDSKIDYSKFKALNSSSIAQWMPISSSGFGIEYNNRPILVNLLDSIKSSNLKITNETVLYISYYWYCESNGVETTSDSYSMVLPSGTEVGANSQDVVSKKEFSELSQNIVIQSKLIEKDTSTMYDHFRCYSYKYNVLNNVNDGDYIVLDSYEFGKTYKLKISIGNQDAILYFVKDELNGFEDIPELTVSNPFVFSANKTYLITINCGHIRVREDNVYIIESSGGIDTTSDSFKDAVLSVIKSNFSNAELTQY